MLMHDGRCVDKQRMAQTRAFRGSILVAAACLASLSAQAERTPVTRLMPAPRVSFPGAVDSNTPIVRELVNGVPRIFAITSFGGSPSLSVGESLESLSDASAVRFDPHPGHGVWMESVIAADDGTWYGFYHHERPADECARADRFIPRLAAARSRDQGQTWEPLGVILEMSPDTTACNSANRFVLGGVGDVSVMLDDAKQDLYFFYSQYVREAASQGVGVARLAWADRDTPVGRVAVWRDGAWLPARELESADGSATSWDYPVGTPLVAPRQPWHDGNPAADAFWGPAIHWNTYLQQYVMLVNRARDETFNTEGIYVAFAPTLDRPDAWSAPQRIASGGGWYAQVVGLEPDGTDRRAGQRARFFQTGKSEFFIQFSK
jgi:hypothetical protein